MQSSGRRAVEGYDSKTVVEESHAGPSTLATNPRRYLAAGGGPLTQQRPKSAKLGRMNRSNRGSQIDGIC